MRVTQLRLHQLEMPLVAPFTTSFGTSHTKHTYVVELQADTPRGPVTGWGECVAMESPLYSAEYLHGAMEVTRRWIAPALFDVADLRAEAFAQHLGHLVGHPMAKAAVEMAVLDAQLRAAEVSFADYLGVTVSTVPSGVSVGIHDDIPSLLQAVAGYVDAGYARIKLKIRPGADLGPVAAIRAEFGAQLPFQVDANAAYTLVDAPHLRRLDEHNLLLIEQPLGEDDLRQHAELATMMRTPMCLDESIESVQAAADAIALKAASVVNIKPGRVGGYLQARTIHDVCRAHGLAVWCGGMLETGIGRAANAALAGLPGFTLTGDISGADRFYAQDIVTEPMRMHDGVVDVPPGPGFGVEVDRELLTRFTSEVLTLTP
ncbi:MAG: o-succinylbenzoate synthase [Ornithinimicrobium sp.]